MKRYISLSLFLFSAIVVLWSITNEYSDDSQLQQPKSKNFVEIFMNEFEMTAMDDAGAPRYIINGKYLQKLNNSNDTEIEQPIFHLLQDKNQWTISADSATMNNKDETVLLNKNVVMQQQNIEPAVTIRTQSLLINTKTQIAQTEEVVDITHGKSRLNSKGMVFNNITSALELSSSVNGYYLPYD